ncbi:MAG: hypothetical protein PHT96_10315 [Syntrophorhabdaceae bacterium]|nr:hypothetical protein [Syntrophorhabdaceae bacterium]
MQLDETKNESASRPTARANSRLLGFAFFSFLFFIILNRLATTTADVDLWGYLAFGRQFWTSGHFPYRDVFSYVPTLDPWVYHEWLTGVIFYPVYKFTGSAGLQVIKYLAGSATCWFVYLTARLRGANPLTSGLLIIMALQGWLFFGYAPVRAQVFTYLFFAVYIFLLERARIKQEWRYLLVLTFIQVLWCNLHGGFLAGLGLIGVYAVGEAISRRPFLPFMYALVFSTVVTLVNPYGFQYWAYLYRAVSMPRPEIWEWASIINAYISGNISWQEIMNPLATLVLVVFLAIRNRWRDITALLALAVTLYLGIKHIRHLVFFYLLMAVYVPCLFNLYIEDLQSKVGFSVVYRRKWTAAIIIITMLLTLLIAVKFIQKSPFTLYVPAEPKSFSGPELYYPVGAVDYINGKGLEGNLLTEFGWGEYIMWNLYPKCKVALDGRYETVYPVIVVTKYFDFIRGGQSYDIFLNDYPPDMILIAARTTLIKKISSNIKWKLVYSDVGSVLFVKR